MPVYNTAGVVKLVDTLDLGSSASRRGGSSPFTRTSQKSETSVFTGVSAFLGLLLHNTYTTNIVKTFSDEVLCWGAEVNGI